MYINIQDMHTPMRLPQSKQPLVIALTAELTNAIEAQGQAL